MSKLREITIQDKALAALKEHYIKEFSLNEDEIYCEKEKCTKRKFGSKRADGLLCFNKNNKYYTVSLEAKSHRTLKALTSSYDDTRFLVHSLITSGVLTCLTILTLIYTTEIKWYFSVLIGLTVLITFTILAAAFYDILDLDNHRFARVINQVKQYPANEQWIAYSIHTNNLLLQTPFEKKRNNVEMLEKLCKRNKIGLILINSRGHSIKIYPVAKKGNFLHYYAQEREIEESVMVRGSIT
ncbi:hypothetical protein OB13_16035 [Pontibacter sp. HJ8]